jgi:hypothetical protein
MDKNLQKIDEVYKKDKETFKKPTPEITEEPVSTEVAPDEPVVELEETKKLETELTIPETETPIETTPEMTVPPDEGIPTIEY